MTTTLTTTFVAPSPQADLDDDMGLTIPEIAKSIGKTFAEIMRLFHANVGYLDQYKIVSVKHSNGLETDSAILSVDDAKYLVARSNTHEGKMYTKWLIQQEKKAETFDQMLDNPENAVKVFQRLVDTQKALNAAMKTKQVADKRAFSAMGTAGALSKKLNVAMEDINTLQHDVICLEAALEAEKTANKPKYQVCGIKVMTTDASDWGIDTCSKVTGAIAHFLAHRNEPTNAKTRAYVHKQLWYNFREGIFVENKHLTLDEWREVVRKALRAYERVRNVFEEIG